MNSHFKRLVLTGASGLPHLRTLAVPAFEETLS